MRYYLIAGEASGDLHGSNLIKALKSQDSQCDFRFWGGDLMAAAGGELVRHYKSSAVMGITDVVRNINKISNNFRFCKQDILQYQPDVIILIDYPGFNLKIAQFAEKYSIKVFYYIAPKLWARGAGRIRKIRKYVDELFIIFPFETEYFAKRGVDAHYYGNPLIDSISQDMCSHETRRDFLSRNKLEDKPVIALLPGSRVSEVKYLVPRFVEMEKMMRNAKWSGYQLIIAGVNSIDCTLYDKYIPKESDIKILYGETYSILSQAEAAVISSGTASLEAAVIGTPQVVCYGFDGFTYMLAKLLVRVKYISLANIIMDKLIFKELVQHDAEPQKILKELDALVYDDHYRQVMLKDYAELKHLLGGTGASLRIADAMIKMLKQ